MIIPFIIADDIGSNLWSFPVNTLSKQYPERAGSVQSIWQESVKLIEGMNCERPTIICSHKHRFIVAQHILEYGTKVDKIILAPESSNTAFTVALATLAALDKNSNALIFIMPRDHPITDNFRFHTELGWGNDEEMIRQYLAEGNDVSKAGAFLFPATRIVSYFKKFAPEIVNAAKKSWSGVQQDSDFYRLPLTGVESSKEHIKMPKVGRPWGDYKILGQGERYVLKRLTVNPGAALSLQYHNHRAEHWVVVKGQIKVHKGEEIFTVKLDQSIYIPIGVHHRIENEENETAEIIEVQTGDKIIEEDIVRLEDMYERL